MYFAKHKVVKVLLGFILFFFLLEFSFRIALFTSGWIKYDSSPNTYSLMMLGGSTSVGEPFHDKISIPKLVQFGLDSLIQDKEIEIYNLAGQGQPIQFAFWQFREASMHVKPGTLLLYSGINDTYHEEGESKNFTFWRLIQHSWVVAKMDQIIHPFNSSRDKFEYYYRALVSTAKEKGWIVICSTLVGNYSAFDPNLFDHEFETSGELATWRMILENDTMCLQARRYYEKSSFKHLPISNYYLAQAYQQMEQLDSAKFFFKKAVNEDASIRPSDYKNQLIIDICLDFDVPCVHAADTFVSRSSQVLPGYDLFMDAHHPNVEGYIILSNLFMRSLEKSLNLSPHPNMELPDVSKAFDLNESFFGNVYFESAQWHFIEASFTLARKERLKTALNYLEMAKVHIEENDEVLFWENIALLLQKDFVQWEKHFISNRNTINFEQNENIWKLNSFESILSDLERAGQEGLVPSELVDEFKEMCK